MPHAMQKNQPIGRSFGAAFLGPFNQSPLTPWKSPAPSPPPWAPVTDAIFDYTSANVQSLIDGGNFVYTDPSPVGYTPPAQTVTFASHGTYAAGGTFSILVPATPPFPALGDLNVLSQPAWLNFNTFLDGALIRATVSASDNSDAADRTGTLVIQFRGKNGANPAQIFTGEINVTQHGFPF